MIKRNHCVISKDSNLELLYSFKNFPTLMTCVDTFPETDIKTDMNWYISKVGVIQLKSLLPLDMLYKNSHGSGTIGSIWKTHHEAFSKFLSQFSFISILEIGGGHGELSNNYLLSHPETKWIIIDPNSTIMNRNVQIIRKLFDSSLKITETPDAIIHSHVFEHIYNPDEFIYTISTISKIGTYHCFSVPNLRLMFENKFTNTLNFEHTIFLTETFIDYLLKKYGFTIKKKQYFLSHSIFYATIKTLPPKVIPEIPNEYGSNKKLFMEFIKFHENLIVDLNKKINNFNGRVYLFGGHIFSQYLIAFGLNSSKITNIIDNDTYKQEKRLYGTNLIVKSPRILSSEYPSALILRAGIYNEEIKKNIDPNVIFWE